MTADERNSLIRALTQIENQIFDLAEQQPTAERHKAVMTVQSAMFDAIYWIAFPEEVRA